MSEKLYHLFARQIHEAFHTRLEQRCWGWNQYLKKDSTFVDVSALKGLGKATVQMDTPYSLQPHLLLIESSEQVPVQSSGSGSAKNHRRNLSFGLSWQPTRLAIKSQRGGSGRFTRWGPRMEGKGKPRCIRHTKLFLSDTMRAWCSFPAPCLPFKKKTKQNTTLQGFPRWYSG